MSLAEQGKRRVGAEELLGLAFALSASLTRLASAEHADGYISLPAGIPVHADSIRMSIYWSGDDVIGWNGNTPVLNPRRRVPAPGGGDQIGWHDWHEPVVTR